MAIVKVRPPRSTPRVARNSVEQVMLAGGGPIISRMRMPGRGVSYFGFNVSKWTVDRGHVVLDPAAPWYQYGNKWFEHLSSALEWAGEEFDVADWARNRLGDYVPADVALRFPLRLT